MAVIHEGPNATPTITQQDCAILATVLGNDYRTLYVYRLTMHVPGQRNVTAICFTQLIRTLINNLSCLVKCILPGRARIQTYSSLPRPLHVVIVRLYF
jgi:hypothetical protein